MKLFNLDDTAVILIDHQVGTNTWASTTPLPLLQCGHARGHASIGGTLS